MALESVTYISDLVPTNPQATDLKAEGDDHLRNIKLGLKNTFPNVSNVVTPTHTELNFVDGVTSAIQTQLDAKAALLSPALTGTPTAPTATVGTNTTQLSTTAFVQAALATMPSGTLPSIAGKSLQGLRVNAGESGVEWATLASGLNSITAATGSATIANGNNPIAWNWAQTTAAQTGFNIGETTASTGGVGSQYLMRVGTLASSTAQPFAVFVRGGAQPAIEVAAAGGINIRTSATQPLSIVTASGAGAGNSIDITIGANTTGAGSNLTLTAGNGTSAVGGDINLTTGTGTTNGRINFTNTNVANGAVAVTLTSLGPTGAATTVQGWLAIKVAGTARFVPFW